MNLGRTAIPKELEESGQTPFCAGKSVSEVEFGALRHSLVNLLTVAIGKNSRRASSRNVMNPYLR